MLKKIPYIHYLIWFQENQRQEDQEQIKALFDSGSKVNAMSPAHAKKLGLKIRNINLGTQKIDDSVLETFGMVITNF